MVKSTSCYLQDWGRSRITLGSYNLWLVWTWHAFAIFKISNACVGKYNKENIFWAWASTLLSSRTSRLISLYFSDDSVDLTSWERTVLFCFLYLTGCSRKNTFVICSKAFTRRIRLFIEMSERLWLQNLKTVLFMYLLSYIQDYF